MLCAKNIGVLVAVLLLGGCFMMQGPRDNSGFRSVEKLEELNGLYKNRGDGGKALQRPLYLSQVIWPDVKDLDHESIHSVKVRATNKNTLVITALREKTVLKESAFIRGKDFELSNGTITLMREFLFPSFVESRGSFAGPSYCSVVVGLDSQNDGKLRRSSAMAGAAFLMIPIAGGEMEDVKFLRLEEQ